MSETEKNNSSGIDARAVSLCISNSGDTRPESWGQGATPNTETISQIPKIEWIAPDSQIAAAGGAEAAAGGAEVAAGGAEAAAGGAEELPSLH